jgi:hypothetical protein
VARGSIQRVGNGKRNGTRYRARWRTPDGASRSKTFTHRRDAERHLSGVEQSKSVGRYVDASAGRTTFRAWADEWLAAQTFDESSRETSASRLRAHLLPTFGPMELRSIRPSSVQAWLRSQQAHCAPSYVRVQLATLSSVLGAAVEDGLVATNPCGARAVRAPLPPRQAAAR